MISFFQAAVLGALQGVTELFPISSLGHSVVLPTLFGWDIHQNDPFFLTFLVATHLATAIVLFLFFFQDWMRIFRGLGRSLRDREIAPDDTDAKLGWLLVMGSIPAGVIGVLLEKQLRGLFASPVSAAIFIAVNGMLLLGAEQLRKRAPEHDTQEGSDERIARRLGWGSAFGIGAAQALALIPGISRSGATMGGGLLAGLSNEDAARFSFLLATPIIGAAAILKIPELFGPEGNGVRGAALVGALFAAATAWASVKFLLRFFETNRLTPFGIYCIIFGITTAFIVAT